MVYYPGTYGNGFISVVFLLSQRRQSNEVREIKLFDTIG